jgi:hypothetical protein
MNVVQPPFASTMVFTIKVEIHPVKLRLATARLDHSFANVSGRLPAGGKIGDKECRGGPAAPAAEGKK